MGYTLELWALSVPALEDELRRPTLDPAAVPADGRTSAEILASWPALAAQVAEVVAAGGGEVAGTLSAYVHAVVRRLGVPYGALDHTSGGGNEFRRRFLSGVVAPQFGTDVVDHLLHRPIAGLTWADYPFLGWLSATEAQVAVGRAAGVPVVAADADVGPLRDLRLALELVGRRGLDLVSAYG
jgi:hypothetical protein